MTDTCTPITLLAGPADCLDGECDEYWTEDGDAIEIQHCSHVNEEQACEQHSVFTSSDYCTHAEPWPCQHDTTGDPR